MLTNEEFRLFRGLIQKESGIELKESRKDFLESRLRKRMQAVGAGSPYRYYRHITNGGRDELMSLLDLLTINETSFFRNRPQMELFRKAILPELIGRKELGSGRSLRIWSAGCSTGEEPYSIAMMVQEALRGLGTWDVKIFASDLSLTALEVASRAEYDCEKVQATVDDEFITRYFERFPVQEKRRDTIGQVESFLPMPVTFRYRVREKIRQLVQFDFHNLKRENRLSDLDVIFCRNVMIYFNDQEQCTLISRFHRLLNEDGYLLIGHSESLHGRVTGFDFIYDNKGTAYQKKRRQDIS